MAEDNIISWNATNWITIVLMVAVGFALLGVASQLVMKYKTPAAA